MDEPSRGTVDETGSGVRRRQWTALATAPGFERCVRETLREVYGYVALLVGRDRSEAEERVVDLYRSLRRAVRTGVVADVTLGALRTAARRSWLEDHFIEVVSVFEVAGHSVATIAELSTLERATLVLRYVNEMSVEAVALELGRSERDVAAVDAHAVRRLRGTSDTTGGWIRAYLGPTVTPAPGLIDRVIDRLSAEPPVDVVVEPPVDVVAEPPVDVVVEPPVDVVAEPPVDVVVEPPVDVVVEPPVDVVVEPPVPDWLSDVGGPSIPSWMSEPEPVLERVEVERIEVERIEVERPDPGTFDSVPFEVAPFEVVESVPVADPSGSADGARRPRWVAAVGALLVAALAGSVAVLLLQGSTDTTIAVTATTVAATTTTSEPAVDTTMLAGVDPMLEDTSGGFDPSCAERSGGSSVPIVWPEDLGLLSSMPTVSVRLPRSIDADSGVASLPVDVTSLLTSDGLILAVRTDEQALARTILASVGLDGTVRWVRCLAGRLEVGSAPEAGIAVAVRDSTEGSDWTVVAVGDGSPGASADPGQRALLDASVSASSDGTSSQGTSSDGGTEGTADGVTVGFSYDGDSGRSVLAGLDGGAVVWTKPDVVLPDDGGFRLAAVDDVDAVVVVVRTCPVEEAETEVVPSSVPDGAERPSFIDCPDGELRGYDLASGDLLWSRAGDHAVRAIADGVALIGNRSGWELIEVGSGETRADRRWEDPATFPLGDDIGSVRLVGGALVVLTGDAVTVWLPDGFGGPFVAVDLI